MSPDALLADTENALSIVIWLYGMIIYDAVADLTKLMKRWRRQEFYPLRARRVEINKRLE